MSHSEEARINYTKQIQAQWDFYQQNLLKKQKRLEFNKKFFGRLPGFKWTITRQEWGILKVKSDILDLRMRIDLLVRNKDINEINFV